MSEIRDILDFLTDWKDDNDKHLQDKISLGVSRGLELFKEKQDAVFDGKIELHGEMCPARKSLMVIKYLLSIPIIVSLLIWYLNHWMKK